MMVRPIVSVITSKETGEVNGLKITVADDDGNATDNNGLSKLAYDPLATAGSGKNMSQLQAPLNALLNIDGIDVVKASNTVTDAIEGVTITCSLPAIAKPELGRGIRSSQN